LTVADILTVGAGTTLKCSGGDFIPGSLTNSGTINCPGYGGYEFNWTGTAADGNWTTAGNWAGGVAPSSTSVVVFDDAYCGVNCNVTMNAAVNVKGLQMESGYTGTITQGAGTTVTVGTKAWTQAGGTFAGNNSAMTFNGPWNFTGGTFTAPASTISIASNISISNGVTLNAGSSTLSLGCTGACSIAPGNVTFNAVTIPAVAACNSYDFGGGTMNIAGNLSFGSSSWCGSTRPLNNGTLSVKGNITVTGSGFGGTAVILAAGNASGQTITGSSSIPNLRIAAGTNPVTLSGTVNVAGDFTMTSVGTFTTTGSVLSLGCTKALCTIVPGTATYADVTIPAIAVCNSYDLAGGTMNVGGTLTLSSSGWCGPPRPVNNGTFNVTGNIITSSAGIGGNALVVAAGNAGGQIITGIATAPIPNLQIAVGANPISLSGSVNVTAATTVTTGALNMASAALTTQSLSLNGTTLTKGGGVLTVNSVVVGTGALFGGTVNP
jgi:hypothetical protein